MKTSSAVFDKQVNPDMRTIVILSNRPWNAEMDKKLAEELNCNIIIIKTKEELEQVSLQQINPEWIFVPHWSNIIPEKIWANWRTVVFHMTELPYGRGGSPLQNLIMQGKKSTVISAIKCTKGIDEGPIYMQKDLDLYGTAEEIYLRTSRIIEVMIKDIIINKPKPRPQEGIPEVFKRRTPEQSNLEKCPPGDIYAWLDQIRMVDAEGYPHAYVISNGMKLEIRRATLRSDGIHADVRIMPN